jgi:glycosyltransferase involved in cell wall biosynthesis
MSKPSETDIDIVLPCYNPVPGWDHVVLERTEALRLAMPYCRFRITVVNDGSRSDRVLAGLKRLEQEGNDIRQISYHPNMGKGFAIRTGVRQSTAQVIMYTDIDFPYTLESMLSVLRPLLDDETDVALAVRNKTYYNALPPLRRWMSRLLKLANAHLLGLHTSDTQGGLKAFRNTLRETFLDTEINRYLFDLEFVYLLSRRKDVRIQAIECNLRQGVVMSPVRLRILIREFLNFFVVIIKR